MSTSTRRWTVPAGSTERPCLCERCVWEWMRREAEAEARWLAEALRPEVCERWTAEAST